MTNITVAEYLEGALESEELQRKQIASAGTIISQFLLVREGLKESVGTAQLDAVAATLTAGIYASNKIVQK